MCAVLRASFTFNTCANSTPLPPLSLAQPAYFTHAEEIGRLRQTTPHLGTRARRRRRLAEQWDMTLKRDIPAQAGWLAGMLQIRRKCAQSPSDRFFLAPRLYASITELRPAGREQRHFLSTQHAQRRALAASRRVRLRADRQPVARD